MKPKTTIINIIDSAKSIKSKVLEYTRSLVTPGISFERNLKGKIFIINKAKTFPRLEPSRREDKIKEIM
ncbi:MAG: hypothetical protein WBE27_03130 [Microgenomates group bacterium]